MAQKIVPRPVAAQPVAPKPVPKPVVPLPVPATPRPVAAAPKPVAAPQSVAKAPAPPVSITHPVETAPEEEKKELTPEQKAERQAKQRVVRARTMSTSGAPVLMLSDINGHEAEYTIQVLVENPKRGKSAERFAKYINGGTVAANFAVEGGPTALDVVWDQQHDFIRIIA